MGLCMHAGLGLSRVRVQHTACEILFLRDQRKESDLLECELMVVVSHHVGAGSSTQVLPLEEQPVL